MLSAKTWNRRQLHLSTRLVPVTGSTLLTTLSAAHAASMTQQAFESSAFPEVLCGCLILPIGITPLYYE